MSRRVQSGGAPYILPTFIVFWLPCGVPKEFQTFLCGNKATHPSGPPKFMSSQHFGRKGCVDGRGHPIHMMPFIILVWYGLFITLLMSGALLNPLKILPLFQQEFYEDLSSFTMAFEGPCDLWRYREGWTSKTRH